jgi:hypothetical protein
VAQIVRDRVGQTRDAVHHRQALCVEEDEFASMAEDHLKAWQAIERAGQDEAKELDTGIIVPEPSLGDCQEFRVWGRIH